MSRHSSDDDRLAALSRKGDPKALATLYRRHAPSLLGYLTRALGERADAEDILHETFLRIFEGRGKYKGQGRFRAWLFTIATRIARDRVKQRRRRGELVETAADLLSPATADDPAGHSERRALMERIESALADLPPGYATAFHLRIREEFTYREIASICGEPEGTLRSRVHHALIRIRRALDDGASNRVIQRQPEEDPR